MPTTRQLIVAEELVLTSILTEAEKSRQNITGSLTKMSHDAFFIASLCARAIADPRGERCKNIISEVYSILTPDQTSKLYEELTQLLTQTQIDNLFLMHMNDDYPETIRMLGDCGLSSETLKILITKRLSISYTSTWVLNRCRKDKDFSLLHFLASNIMPDFMPSHALLYAIYEIPLTDKNRIDTIKKLIHTNASFSSTYVDLPHLNSFDHAVNLKDYEVIAYMIETASHQKNKENIQLVANGIARSITDEKISGYFNEIVKAVNKKLSQQSRDSVVEALRKSLTKDQANKFFLAHLNDKLPNETLDLLMHYGINNETYMQAIEACTDLKNAEVYLNQILEQKPQTAVLQNVIRKVINRSETSKDWRFADILASNIIPGNEEAYGDLLLIATKYQQKEIVRKLIKANAKLNYRTIPENKNALHFMIEHKWNDVIEEMLKNAEGIKLLASGIALIMHSSNNCMDIIKTVNALLKDKNVSASFYEALHVSLTLQQADEVFIKHVSDATWPVLDMLMGYRVSPEALIKNIEITPYNDDYLIYLDKLLEQKLDATQFTQLMNIAIIRSKKYGNWSLIDKIASKQLQIPGSEKIYGKALLEAIKANTSQELIKKFLQVHAFLNEQTEDTQNTALHLAAERGDCKLTCLLLNAGASTDIKNKAQKTPADCAMNAKNYYVAALLKSNNSEKIKGQQDRYSIDQLNILYHLFIDDSHSLQLILDEDYLCKVKDEKSESLRTRPKLSSVIFNAVNACQSQALLDNKLEIFKQLLKNNLLKIPSSELKEIVNYQDENGNTALHIAASRGHFDLVKLLWEAGANPNQGNKLGETPLTLAERNKNLTIATILKTAPKNKADVFRKIYQYGGEIKTLEQHLQKNEQNIKRTIYKALMNDHIAIQEAINYYRYYYKYDRFIILSAIGAMYSQLDLQLTSYQSDIIDLKIDDLSWLRHGVSSADKQKLNYLQDFFSSNLEALRQTKNQEKYKDLDPFTLILLVMKQQLKNPTYKQSMTKHNIESGIRSIMSDELGMSSEEINQQMDRSKYIVDKILGLNQPELKQNAEEKESDLLRAALQGEVYGLRRMVDTYHGDTKIPEYAKFELRENLFPRHGRLMLFSAVIAPFVSESDHATYLFYLKNLNLKTMLRSYEKIKVLSLMKEFYLYSFEISKSLKQHYNVHDPFMLIFLVLEYASKYKKFSAAEIKIINNRLKESLNSAMLYEGGLTKMESDTFISEKETQVSAIVRLQPLAYEDKLQTPIETSETSIPVPMAQAVDHDIPPAYLPSAPDMPALPLTAKQVHIHTETPMPPLAEVVRLPESAPLTDMPVAQPEAITNVSDNPSSFFAPSSPTKLSADAMKDLEYLILREQLLDLPLPPDSSDLIAQNNVESNTTHRLELC